MEPQPDLLQQRELLHEVRRHRRVRRSRWRSAATSTAPSARSSPTPVGTGVLIAGGNFDSTDHNWIYDNWRYGTMQFWVPAALRDDYDPLAPERHVAPQPHHRQPHGHPAERLGRTTTASDHWWDDQGDGNCWQDNAYSRGEQTDNFTVPPPSCADGGSVFTPGRPGQGRGLPVLQPVRPQRPDLAAPRRAASGSTARRGRRRPTPAAPAVDSDTDNLVAAPVLAMIGTLLLAFGLGRRRRGTRAA